jgi:hypothetical protein
MFVRWQLYRSQARNKHVRANRAGSARLRAVLVEAVRIDGRPRQKHVAVLGSTSIDGSDRPRFWYDVTTRLDRLRLSRQERERIGAAIAKKVGGQLLTKAQIKQFERKRAQLLRSSSEALAP